MTMDNPSTFVRVFLRFFKNFHFDHFALGYFVPLLNHWVSGDELENLIFD
jgi:hypothetical protein